MRHKMESSVSRNSCWALAQQEYPGSSPFDLENEFWLPRTHLQQVKVPDNRIAVGAQLSGKANVCDSEALS